jgi:hypothetical protein
MHRNIFSKIRSVLALPHTAVNSVDVEDCGTGWTASERRGTVIGDLAQREPSNGMMFPLEVDSKGGHQRPVHNSASTTNPD